MHVNQTISGAAIIIVVVLLWAVNKFVPMEARDRKITNFLVVALLLIALLTLFLPLAG